MGAAPENTATTEQARAELGAQLLDDYEARVSVRLPRHTRTAARVHKVQATAAFVVIPAWRRGAILARVDIRELITATGLIHQQMKGRELTVEVRLDALLEEELDARGWQLARPSSVDSGSWRRADTSSEPLSWPESA
ncbi:hypothetical protein [Streptacidiphilus anmyonensis]|uniref:hypothetical protein n=1 Tax=Streptacidiphilus anmyonensis TaxID=405782 RepID=UPI0005A7DC90|nr:hypothetical protein [Streptacidiphilus anmyonensis]